MIVATTVIHDCGRLASYDVTTSTLTCPCTRKRTPTMRPMLTAAILVTAALAVVAVMFAPADPAPVADREPTTQGVGE